MTDNEFEEIIKILKSNNIQKNIINKQICILGFEETIKNIDNFKKEELLYLINKNQANYLKEDFNCHNCPVCKYCSNYRLKQISKKKVGLSYIDLFCGAGGLSLGFKQEGYILNFANDIDKDCIRTYKFNHPEVPANQVICNDINNILENINKYSQLEETDIIIGGPPCQGFSMANRQRIIDDPRNNLYKSYIKAVELIKPRFVVMENVKGMLSVVDQIKADFNKIGYEVSASIFNVKDFGIPQNRERIIFIGNRIGIDNNKIIEMIHAESKKINKVVLRDALYGLKELKASNKSNNTNDCNESGSFVYFNNSDINDYINLINNNQKFNFIFNHKARFNNLRDIEIYGRLNQGDNSSDSKIADIMPYKNRNHIFKDKYFKLENEKICKTITAHMKYDCNMYIHPTQARGLTPREAARIQSYPDDYIFKGAYTKTYMQIGNSVPPLFSRVIAKILKNYLKS